MPTCQGLLFETGKICQIATTGKYCNDHLYLDTYTADQLVKLTKCHACKKWCIVKM